jgi:hypothetical protein
MGTLDGRGVGFGIHELINETTARKGRTRFTLAPHSSPPKNPINHLSPTPEEGTFLSLSSKSIVPNSWETSPLFQENRESFKIILSYNDYIDF